MADDHPRVASSSAVQSAVLDFLTKPSTAPSFNPGLERQFEHHPEKFKSASIYRRSDVPKPAESIITAEDIVDMDTSRDAEMETTPSHTYEPSMSKVVAKKARKSENRHVKSLAVHTVRVNEDFGKPENMERSTSAILSASEFGKAQAPRGNDTVQAPNPPMNLPEPLSHIMHKQKARSSQGSSLSVAYNKPIVPDTAFSDYMESMEQEKQDQDDVQEAAGNTVAESMETASDKTTSVTKVKNLLHPATVAYTKPAGPVTCNSRGGLTLDYEDPDSNRRTGIMQRPVIPMNRAPLYQLNYLPEERQRVTNQIMQATARTTQNINLHMLSHLASISNGAPYIRDASKSILEEKELVHDVVMVPFSVLKSFLRAPSDKESPCVANSSCIGLTLDIPRPFVLVSFYLLEWAKQKNESCITEEMAEEWQKCYDMPYRDIRGVVSCNDSLCVLCILFHANAEVYSHSMNRTSQDSLRRIIASPISCAVDIEGELRTQYTTSPGYGTFNTLVEHIPMYLKSMLEEGPPVLVDNQYVAALNYKVECYSRMSSEAHFRTGSKCN